MTVKTIPMTPQQIAALKQKLQHAKERKTPPYAHFQYELSDCVITAYESGKVVFQGEGAAFYADSMENRPAFDETKNDASFPGGFPQAGSDEVGTGDYFGPVVVCACLLQPQDAAFVQSLGVQDSKALQDAHIRNIAPLLQERLCHSLLILDNARYNQVHEQNNMVAIKCKLHNQAYVHLQRKANGLPPNRIIDQFVQEKSYYRYLRDQPSVIRDIHFETKAENKYPAVACASVIARYAFLKAFDQLCERYAFSFPKGAGKQVDEAIRTFLQSHSMEDLRQVAKLHFANTKKACLSVDQK